MWLVPRRASLFSSGAKVWSAIKGACGFSLLALHGRMFVVLGVLILNTGTPDAPTPEAIRPYLKQFLSDRNLINVPRLIWKPVLNFCILPNRPKKTAAHYQQFWTEEGSPFLLTSLVQRDKLRVRLAELMGEPVAVELGMRYGNPSTKSAIEALLDAGVSRIVVVPLYPQETKACAGTCLEEFERAFGEAMAERPKRMRPEVRTISHYWNAPGYLDALAQSVRDAWSYEPGKKLVVSFHSIPVSFQAAGDTYPESTKATAEGLASKLGIAPEDVVLTYQSRFDSRKWLGPFLGPELRRLAAEGAHDVAVVCPIFSVDCIETSYEVGIEAREEFVSTAREGGAEFHLYPGAWRSRFCYWRAGESHYGEGRVKPHVPRAFLSFMASLFFLVCHKA